MEDRIKNKVQKQYKKKIPKKFIGNFNKNIDSKKNIKYLNKNIKILTKKLGINKYTISKKDFIKSIFKIKP